MANPNYQLLHIRLSREIGDVVSSASTDGDNATKELRDIILNNAIREWINLKLNGFDKEALRNYIIVQNWNPLSFSTFSISTSSGGKQTITGVSGILAAHVGASFTGHDGLSDPFNKTITDYVSATSFKIADGITDGVGTDGVLTPTTPLTNNVFSISLLTYSPYRILSLYDNTLLKIVMPLSTKLNRYSIQNQIAPSSFIDLYYEQQGGDLYIIGAGASDKFSIEYVKQHTDLAYNDSTDIQIDSQYFGEILKLAVNIYNTEIKPTNA